MNTVPSGNDHSPVGEYLIFSPFGTAIQRCLTAPSDHNGELTSYGMHPDIGVSSSSCSRLAKALSAESLSGAANVMLILRSISEAGTSFKIFDGRPILQMYSSSS